MEAPKKKKQTDAMDACCLWARLHHPISAVQSQGAVAWKIARYSSIRLTDDAIGAHCGSTAGGLAWPVQGASANHRVWRLIPEASRYLQVDVYKYKYDDSGKHCSVDMYRLFR